MTALPCPCLAVRVQQADLFNNHESDCNVMVATDAIGLGLNLCVKYIVFHSLNVRFFPSL